MEVAQVVWPYHHATEDPGSSCLTAHSQPYKTKCLLCILGRKKEERQGTKRLHLLGLWLLFGKGRSPLRTFFCSSSAKLVSYGQALLPWWLGILVLHGLASLVQGSIWLGMGRVNRSLVPKRPSSYPTCLSFLISNLKDMIYTIYLEQMCDSPYPGSILLHGRFFLIFQVPVKVASLKRIL